MSTPRLAITTAVLEPSSDLVKRCLASWVVTRSLPNESLEVVSLHNKTTDNLGVTGSLQWLYEHTTASVIAFLHSDLEIFESGWDERVLREFDDPAVGVVGFGGALQLGEDDIYKTRYQLTQLRRIDYRSNTRDAETHGERFTGSCDVATLDGFALAVRRELLDHWSHCESKYHPIGQMGDSFIYRKAGYITGWPVERYPFHNYDNALCIKAHQLGYRVRLIGIDCQHHGGATSTSPEGQAHWQALGTTDAEIHEQSHRYLYEDGRGILPWRAR